MTSGRMSSSRMHCVFRSVLLAFGLIVTIYVSIPDYPRTGSLFEVLAFDANGWLHEVFYIWAFVLSAMFTSVLWQVLTAWRHVGILIGALLERIEKDL